MLVKEFYKQIKKGYNPVVKINEEFQCNAEESADTDMLCKVISAMPSGYDDDSYRFEIDFNGFEEHNYKVAEPSWRDDKGNAVLKWMDSKYYPQNGIDAVYLPGDIEIPFDIIEENSLFGEYIKEKSSLSYVEWLENLVMELRK